MDVPTSEVGYTPAMPRREDHEVHKGHVVALKKKYFGHHYAHHQELPTIALVTTLAVCFSSCCWMEVRCRQDG